MAHTHEYDCTVCGAHFDSSKDVARHTEEAHPKNATSIERPRADRVAGENAPNVGPDRNPRQGFVDPSKDASEST